VAKKKNIASDTRTWKVERNLKNVNSPKISRSYHSFKMNFESNVREEEKNISFIKNLIWVWNVEDPSCFVLLAHTRIMSCACVCHFFSIFT
jgi:hypothetical protein